MKQRHRDFCSLLLKLFIIMILISAISYLLASKSKESQPHQTTVLEFREEPVYSKRLLYIYPYDEDRKVNPTFNCLQSWHNYVRLFAHYWAFNYFDWQLMMDAYSNSQKISSSTCVGFNEDIKKMSPKCNERINGYFTKLFYIVLKSLGWQFGTVREGLRSTIKEAYNISMECKMLSEDELMKLDTQKSLESILRLFE